VRFEVEDQGAGISRQDAARIFDRFYRTSDAESSGNPGLGLGLAIVREIARHHGGEVTVASELGKGSRFTLAIPTAKSAVRQ
jgi:signal transduction histidine kinase